MGAGEGTDNLDFLADLSALKVIDPNSISKAPPPGDVPVPNSPSILLEQLMQESIPYFHCAWCHETPKTRSMLEEHYYEIHHVVLQPSCCAPPSVSQAIMGMELQLRQANFGSYSQRSCASKRSDAVRRSKEHPWRNVCSARRQDQATVCQNASVRAVGGHIPGSTVPPR